MAQISYITMMTRILHTRAKNAGLATMLVSWRTFDETLRAVLIRRYQSQSSDTSNISVRAQESNVRIVCWKIQLADTRSNPIRTGLVWIIQNSYGVSVRSL
jgi:hypothetical protein